MSDEVEDRDESFHWGKERANTGKTLKNLATNLNIGLICYQFIGNYKCYVSRFNSLIIRSSGNIAKRAVALYDRRNAIGKIDDDGKIKFDVGEFSWRIRDNFTGNEQQLHCPLRAPDWA
ncbi:MAG: hypothetical protein QW578_07330 [Thermoplasmatales archaeon]